ncbi:MAG: alginate export family protein [Spirochaetales bacterium]|nr:alginate export family protein [Spirochaetales bacterium]
MKPILLLCALLAAFALPVGAEDFSDDDDFFALMPTKAPWLLDWGATASPAALLENQGGGNEAVAALSGNAWVRLSLPGMWRFYGRLKGSALLSVLPAGEDAMTLTTPWEINAAYLQLMDPDVGLTLTLGRQPFLLGSGLVLSGSGDGLEFKLTNSLFSAQAFGYYTGLLDTEFSTYAMHDWDEANGARRYITGYALGVGLGGHDLSLLGLYQGDFGLSPDDLYTSWYTGLQARGVFLGGDYLAEWYLQEGYSPSGDSSGAIDAYGGTTRYRRVFGIPTSPTVTLRYSLASGDADRTVTDVAVGNTSGLDTAFQSFGTLDVGVAFKPDFSNLHIAQAAFSFRPLEAAGRSLRGTSLGVSYQYYAKHVAAGVVNDGEATLASLDVGHGIDASLRLAPWNDLDIFVGGGVFIPGAAFPAGEALRYAVSGGMSLSF